ncbi:homoserine dehydrogenase [Ruaniaceae bacterium KH17]|nr:homoserine dehydrogenase [Ruaniaceae bacterium KH17]
MTPIQPMAGAQARAATAPVRIGVLGCGTVGSEVIRLLGERAEDFAQRSGADLELTGIAVRDLETPRGPHVDPALLTTDARAVATNADIVIELIGGISPARELVLAALATGATVVTGNKALLAAHGPELFDAAAASGADLYYEAAVAGAVPVVYALRESLAGDTVTRVLGIVNGTTNYILDEMATKGLSFDTVLATAQELGFAEADPTADVDGHDAAAKAALLAQLAFHTRVGIDQVSVSGIRNVTAEDIAQAESAGYTLKLLAIAERVGDDAINVRVAPTLVPHTHPLSSVHGAFNAIVVESESAGRLMFYGQGAGGAPTASAVLSDVVAAASHKVRGGNAPRESAYAALRVVGPEETTYAQRVRVRVADEPGVLARVAGSHAEHGVSIQSVGQLADVEGDSVVAIVTHPSRGAALTAVTEELGNEPAVREILSVTPVEA